MIRRFLAILTPLILAASLAADVKLPGLFSDHMVLQQGIPVPVWGWATGGESVTVNFRNHSITTITAPDGTWRVNLPRQKAGGPFSLTVQGKNRIDLQDVLVGEVWVCSGQSNMEWPLSASFEPAADIAAATRPNIRLFTVPKLKAEQPANNVNASWQPCTADTAKSFSAVGYYFGRDLHQARNVPIGLIHTSWGGSPAEAWMREGILAANAEYKRDILDPYPEQRRKFEADVAAWEKETAALKAQGKEQTRGRPWANWQPAELYNGMIAPLLPYAIAGAIWYQGESNAGRAHQYRHLFPNMIQNWRDDWRQGDFPFIAVQLAPWDKNRKRSAEEIASLPGDSDWAELREAQLMAAQAMKNVGMAVITDVGDKDDIHPAKKEPVGARLALQARSIAYHENITASGPTLRSFKTKKNTIVLSFDNTGGGLESRGGKLRGFAIAAVDGKFFWAEARIDGSKVTVSHPLIQKPFAVRYGWADYPIVNLFNKAGLPATPFRTDNFPMITAPKD